MKRPPLLLALFAITYLAFIIWQIYSAYQPALWGRLGLTLVLFLFVFRGSRVAGNILAILCAITALVLLVAAIAAFNANTISAVLLIVTAGLLLVFSAYLFFSPAVRTFQGKAPSDTSS